MESNALVRSMKAIIKVCSLHFSWICHAEKIMSAVPRAGLKPHWDSGRVSLAMGKRQHARTQDLPNNRKQGEFPQFVLSPFLKMETIRASCKIAGNYTRPTLMPFRSLVVLLLLLGSFCLCPVVNLALILLVVLSVSWFTYTISWIEDYEMQ